MKLNRAGKIMMVVWVVIVILIGREYKRMNEIAMTDEIEHYIETVSEYNERMKIK